MTSALDLTNSDGTDVDPAVGAVDWAAVAKAVEAAVVAAGLPTAFADGVDVAGQLAARVGALAAERDQYREALAVIRVKATTLDRQPRAILQWIGRYCAIASISPSPPTDDSGGDAAEPTSDDSDGTSTGGGER